MSTQCFICTKGAVIKCFGCDNELRHYCQECDQFIHRSKFMYHMRKLLVENIIECKQDEIEEPDAAEPVYEDQKFTPEDCEPQERYCRYFSKGFCKLGADCEYYHYCIRCDKEYNGSSSCDICYVHCSENFFCPEGLSCKLYHSKRERITFQLNGGKGLERKGTKKCNYGTSCRNRGCKFAHCKEEMQCIYCLVKGDHVGSECPG